MFSVLPLNARSRCGCCLLNQRTQRKCHAYWTRAPSLQQEVHSQAVENKPSAITRYQGGKDMKMLIIAGLALSALLVAAQQSHAYVNYPWCIQGDTRGNECIFASKEQCAQDGRNRGFGGTCHPNPNYNPNLPHVVETPAKKPDQPRKPHR
jgi:hypothetical protein